MAREFIAQGNRVAFVTTHDEFPAGRVDLGQPLTYELPPDLNIVRLEGRFRSRLRNFHPANPPVWLPGLARAVLQLKPNAVIFFNIGWPLTVLPALLALRRRTTVLYQTAYHAPLTQCRLDPWRSWLQLKVAGLSHHLIPHSHYEKGQIVRDGGIPESRVTVVYPGVDLWDFQRDEVQKFRAEYELMGKLVVSHVARLGIFKGTDKLIEVLPQVREQTGRDVVLLLVGRSAEKEYLDRLIDDRDVRRSVRFTGPVSERDLHLAYAASDVFALPSQYESFGFVFLEAMSHGIPVIGVRTGGVPEVIQDGETGFILDSAGDVGGLTDRLSHLLGEDEFRTRCGERARAWTRERFSWSVAANTVRDLVEQVNR